MEERTRLPFKTASDIVREDDERRAQELLPGMEGFEPQCSKGWQARCARAKSKASRCRCKCGGFNHHTAGGNDGPAPH